MDQAAVRAPRRFPRTLKYLLVALALFALVLGAVLTYIAATFDPRDHHQRVVDLVREKTGRTLEIRGETTLSFWPNVGVRTGPLTLTERGTTEVFASIESARISLEIKPLLAREIVASELALSGADVRITRDAQGRLNIADLLEGEGEPPRFDIGSVAIDRSKIVYRDLATGAHYEIGALELKTGRLIANAASPVTLSAVVRLGNDAPSIAIKLATRLEFDLPQKRYTLTPVKADLAGTYGEDALTLAASAGKVAITPARIEAQAVRLDLLAKGPAGVTEAKLGLPTVAVEGDAVGSAAATLDLTLDRGEHRVRAAISTPFEARLAARAVKLPQLAATFTAFGPRLPRKGLEGAVQGEAALDVAKEGVHVRLAGRVGASNVKAQVAAAGFASPVYTFAVELDRLDLDHYAAGDPPARKPTRAGRVEDFLEVLEGLPASGTLTVGVLESAGTKARNVKIALK